MSLRAIFRFFDDRYAFGQVEKLNYVPLLNRGLSTRGAESVARGYYQELDRSPEVTDRGSAESADFDLSASADRRKAAIDQERQRRRRQS